MGLLATPNSSSLGKANASIALLSFVRRLRNPCSAVFSQEQEASRLLSRSHPFRTRHIDEVCHKKCR